jgi:hypothetical protein
LDTNVNLLFNVVAVLVSWTNHCPLFCAKGDLNMAYAAKRRNLGTPPILAGGKLENGEVVYEESLDFRSAIDFEASLATWVGRYVSHSSVAVLMRDADGLREIISYLQNAPTTMSGKRTIKLHLIWDRLSTGQWYVEGIGFSLRDGMRNIHQANTAQLRQRLLDKAEQEAMRNVPDWKVYFNIDQVGDNYLNDAAEGQRMIDTLFPIAHKAAKGLVPMLKNPIGPDFDDDKSIAEEVLKAAAGTLEGPIGDAFKAGDAADKVKSNIESGSGWKAAGDITDLGLPLLFAEAGPVGGMGSSIIGSFIEIGIASDAARVAKARGRLYLFFVSGYLSNIFQPTITLPIRPAKGKPGSLTLYYMDKQMFELGAKQSVAYSPRKKFLAQLALLHFVATHNTENEWNFQNRMQKGWQFPTHYTAFWNRELMARAFTWQFFKGKYRYK